MREIVVDSKCMGCGQCVLNCVYLKENEEGKACFVKEMDIPDSDLPGVNKVIEQCPVSALSIRTVSVASGAEKEVLQKIVSQLEKDIAEVKIPRITESDIKFVESDYSIMPVYSNNEYAAKYSSESQARSAARSEFQKLLYSESAYRPMLKQVFVDYKVKVLKPYYTYENNNNSYYFRFNQKYMDKLRVYYSDIKRALGDKCSLLESWKEFEVYPATGKGGIGDEIDTARFFDERSLSSGIMTEMKNDRYTSLDYYIDSMDFDYQEEYAGEGLFGSTKMKKKWYFTGFS